MQSHMALTQNESNLDLIGRTNKWVGNCVKVKYILFILVGFAKNAHLFDY